MPGAGALEHVPHVRATVLDCTGEGGASRPGCRDVGTLRTGGPLGRLRFDVHRLLPVDPVAVANEKCDGGARRTSATNTADDLGAVAFDLHPPAAPVAA